MRQVGFAISILAASGCNWARFDDLQENAPVVVLEKPEKLKSGFGVTLATASYDEETRALAGGASGKSPAAAFTLGFDENPKTDAVDTGSCDQGEDVDCYLADRIAGLPRSDTTGGEGTLCFALGIGITPASSDDYGILARCADKTEYTLPVPPVVLDRLIKKAVLLNTAAEPLVLFTDRAEAPALVAGAKSKKLAWFYGPLSAKPVLLQPPVDSEERGGDYGAAVASVRVGDTDGRVLAVGAPEADRVWLFRSENGRAADPVGCLGGPTAFGRLLTSGDVDGDGIDDLVIADSTNVSVVSGEALDALRPADAIECTLASLPPGGLIASFGCGSRGTVTGCDENFASALTVADLDGDGDGEVVVGAADFEVRDERGAGALLVYDVEHERPGELTDVLFLASREKNDRLGAAVATAKTRERDVVVAGAPGSGRAAVFYCSSLVPDDKKGKRCNH